MAYLGNSPARSFISFERQVFTIVNSQTVYTLDHSVTNENDIRLVINNVVQEPGSGKAYTASGTTLTLSAALTSGTDEMYCVYLGRATATEAPGAGSVGTSQLASDAVTEAKIADGAVESEHLNNNVISGQTALGATPADTDEFLVSDAGTIKRVDYSYIKGGANTPSFMASISGGDQTLTNSATNTLALNTEVYDSDSAYDNSTYRFTVPSGEGGKYLVGLGGQFETNSAGNMDNFALRIAVNGSTVIDAPDYPGGTTENRLPYFNTSGVLNLSAGDYVEPKAYISLSSGTPKYKNGAGQFFAVKIIGA